MVLHFRLNPGYKIDIHHAAVSDRAGTVQYESVKYPGCNGCNGGISSSINTSGGAGGYQISSVRLEPFLQERYGQAFIAQICLVKIDTEGHDLTILSDFPPTFRPPLLWVEWFGTMKFSVSRNKSQQILEDDELCTEASAEYFRKISQLGYEIFEPTLPLKRMVGCANKFYRDDLLLIERKFLTNYIEKHPRVRQFIKNYKLIGKPYVINIFNGEDYNLI